MKKLLMLLMMLSAVYAQSDIETREFLSETPVDFEGDVFFEDKIKIGDNGDHSRMIKKTVNNKCLVGNISVPDIESQLIELKNFYSKGGKE